MSSSVKFQEETVRAVGNNIKDDSFRVVADKSDDFLHKVGEDLTGGATQTGYLAVCG